MPHEEGYTHSESSGGKMKDSKKNDRAMSPKDLGVTYCEAITGSPESAGLGSSGPNQVPKGVPKMHGNRKGTGSSKI